MPTDITISPLTTNTLTAATALVSTVFPYESPEFVKETLATSLLPTHRHIFLDIVCTGLWYWVAIDAKNQKIVGATGLYTIEPDEKEATWLSWFCVDPEYRGRGIGSLLLDFSIATAKQKNKKWLRLYTEDHPNEKNAHRLYEKYGFLPFQPPKEITLDKPMLYKQLLLQKTDV